MKTLASFAAVTAALVAVVRASGYAPDGVVVFACAFAAGLVFLLVSDYRPNRRLFFRPRPAPTAQPLRRIRPECPVYRSPYGPLIIFDTTVR